MTRSVEPLVEIPRVRQAPLGDLTRRWFTCPHIDLFTWQNTAREIVKFELCYDKQGKERSLIWSDPGGFSHSRIDGGEDSVFKNQTPIAIADGDYDREAIALDLEPLAVKLEPSVYRVLMRVLWLGR
ncbi:MAG: hypothetical protein HOI95_01645 [Chromatiales bacterium]|nr:hypothetical protein [Chromatiales bacterium]